MNAPTIRLSVLVLVGLLAASTRAPAQDAPTAPATGTTAIEHHDLALTLDPASGRLEALDRIRVRRGRDPFEFMLRADLALGVLTVDGSPVESVQRVPDEAPRGWARYRLGLPRLEGTSTVALAYSGVVREDVRRAEDLAFVIGDHSSGTISKEGVFLTDSTGWVPRDGSMATYAVTATVPAGWSVATQGGVPVRTEGEDGAVTFAFPAGIPYDGLWLQAGQWVVERRMLPNGTSVGTYLSEANAGVAKHVFTALEEYLALYEKVLGPYPHAKFDVVENFFTSGYGMPTATLLGPRVLMRVGMVAEQSGGIPPGYVDHELVHCWWGNGVFVDYDSGNWCEGLTSYCSNYLRKEMADADAAREHRLRTRSRFAMRVTAERDYPVRQFTGKTEDFENDIGYGKCSMLFHAVRRRIGDDAFFAALRRLTSEYVGKRAGWDALRGVFEKESGQNLEAFFAQYLDRKGAPVLRLAETTVTAAEDGWHVEGVVRQEGAPWSLQVPLVVETAFGDETTTLEVRGAETAFRLRTDSVPLRVLLDPDSQCWRGFAPGEVPPSLDAVLNADGFRIVVPEGEAGAPFAPVVAALAQRPGVEVVERPAGSDWREYRGDGAALVLGLGDATDLPAAPFRIAPGMVRAGGKRFRGDDVAVLATFREGTGADSRVTTVYHGLSPAALANARHLFYYGGDGLVVFQGGRPALRAPGEGDASARASLLDTVLPPGDTTRIGSTLAALTDPTLRGRGVEESGQALARRRLMELFGREDGHAVTEQVFTVPSPDWNGSDAGGVPFAFSAPTQDWIDVPATAPIMVTAETTEADLLGAIRSAVEEGAPAIVVRGPVEPPEFVGDWLLYPSRLPEDVAADLERRRTSGGDGDPNRYVVARRSRRLQPDFTIPVPVVYSGAPPETSSVPGRIRAPFTTGGYETANLVVTLPGSDPDLADQPVLLTAHYDGLGPDYAGADDNASGVAAVREALYLLAWDDSARPRPVVAVLFGAEEWGLQGSRWFAEHLPEGLGTPIAALNLDSVGRKGVPSVHVLGESVYPALGRAAQRALVAAGLDVGADIDRYAFPHGSDHWPLHVAGIPAIGLWSSDYAVMNTKRDTADGVSGEKVASIARAAAAWALAVSREGAPE